MLILNQTEVLMNNVQHVEQLALILMNAFDLDIKQRLRVDGHSRRVLDDDGQPFFVGALDAHEFLLKPRILASGSSALRASRSVIQPVANGLSEQLRQERDWPAATTGAG